MDHDDLRPERHLADAGYIDADGLAAVVMVGAVVAHHREDSGPRARITTAASRAMARLERAAWSLEDRGLEFAPEPRRSMGTTAWVLPSAVASAG